MFPHSILAISLTVKLPLAGLIRISSSFDAGSDAAEI